MKKDPELRIPGKRSITRLARIDDARFLYDLRHSPHVGRIMAPLAGYEQHVEWLRANIADYHAYTFIVEDPDGVPCGSIALDNVDFVTKHAYSERWMSDPARGLGPEIMRAHLDFAFGELGMKTVFARVYETNAAVLRGDKLFGFEEYDRVPEDKLVNGVSHMYVMLRLSPERWRKARERCARMGMFE